MAKRYFIVRVNGKDTDHIFTGVSPRHAALKAARRGFAKIEFRERGRRNSDGTFTLHLFFGKRKKVSAPDNAPAFVPKKIWMPVVRKVKTIRSTKL